MNQIRDGLLQCGGVSDVSVQPSGQQEFSVLVSGSAPLHTLLESSRHLAVDVRVVSQGAPPPPPPHSHSSLINESGKRVLQTLDRSFAAQPLASAVAQFTTAPVLGLVRLSEVSPQETVIDVDISLSSNTASADNQAAEAAAAAAASSAQITTSTGTVDSGSSFSPSLLPTASRHTIAAHVSGDISSGFQSIGERYAFGDKARDGGCRAYQGSLGIFLRTDRNELTGRTERSHLSVGDLIGRTICVYADADNAESNASQLAATPLACAVIARSAGVLENPKRLCTCDGTTIWESQ